MCSQDSYCKTSRRDVTRLPYSPFCARHPEPLFARGRVLRIFDSFSWGPTVDAFLDDSPPSPTLPLPQLHYAEQHTIQFAYLHTTCQHDPLPASLITSLFRVIPLPKTKLSYSMNALRKHMAHSHCNFADQPHHSARQRLRRQLEVEQYTTVTTPRPCT